MSFKGIKKSLVRAPQSLRQKMNMGEVTQDAVYLDAERRFKELEMETKKLSDESKRYFTAVNGMLDYQIDFSKAIEEIYKPISGRLSDPNATVPEDNPEGIKAAEQYREVVKEMKETLKPDLELIEKRIVDPAQELLKVINSIRKMATKRDHKQVDLDRHKRTYKKYEEKKERTVKDEEKMYAAEAEVQIAQQEYDYYNEMLKQELPVLFQMQLDFIKPLFVSFYYMQLNIFYTLYTRMEELKIPYFDLNLDIVEAYTAKKGNIEDLTDEIGITHFKVGHAKNKLEAVKRRHQMMGGPGSAPNSASGSSLPSYYQSPDSTYAQYGAGNEKQGFPNEKAGYSASPISATGAPASYGTQFNAPQASSYPQPVGATTQAGALLPPPYQNAPVATCTALYDYNAQAQGDLTFTAGAVIEVVEKGDANAWWTGRYNGQTGSFPGNYVRLN
ncbi:hypothetical protein PUMCH_002328 [Australozyma saopauloensis]|uniref:Uncharacterized protein n=1 Tax=Australozyma saopauloensis TaxID=291208 RepID=A0AAX4H9R3_9ASCO|nr:hypothetical protein PUMCH_002328 [[Candida] saopauloensis]